MSTLADCGWFGTLTTSRTLRPLKAVAGKGKIFLPCNEWRHAFILFHQKQQLPHQNSEKLLARRKSTSSSRRSLSSFVNQCKIFCISTTPLRVANVTLARFRLRVVAYQRHSGLPEMVRQTSPFLSDPSLFVSRRDKLILTTLLC